MNKGRLERLVQVLENVPKEHFDLAQWACGSAACAVGWGCRDPQLLEEGLHLTNPAFGAPAYKHLIEWEAVCEFFGLDRDEAFDLFHLRGYRDMAGKVGPQEVIARIRKLLGSEA